ncbi:MAG: hypothetical protein AAGG01_24170, partial [Planctomycetota bacterium]
MTRRPQLGRLGALLTAAFFLGCAVCVHAWVGAFDAEFGGFEDEPAHLVTALMIRDWLIAGTQDLSVLLEPRAYAERYYIHYPKVSIGQWPPVFHGALAAWMLLVGSTQLAIVFFMTVLTALTAFVVYLAMGRTMG